MQEQLPRHEAIYSWWSGEQEIIGVREQLFLILDEREDRVNFPNRFVILEMPV